MYRRAVVSIALVAVAVLTAGGGALALLGSGGSSAEPVAEQVLFDVGEAGSVIVSSDGSSLEVVDVTASHGWEHRIAASSGSSVNVVFEARGMGIDFHADLVDSSVVGRIQILASSPPQRSTPSVGDEDTATTATDTAKPELASSDLPVHRQQAGGLEPEPAAIAHAPQPPGAGVELGLEYGKISGETPVIDPVLDSQPAG